MVREAEAVGEARAVAACEPEAAPASRDRAVFVSCDGDGDDGDRRTDDE